MAIRVTDTSTPLWQIYDEESQHGGEADPSTVHYGTFMDGSEDRSTVVVPCPVCGSVSYWPSETILAEVRERLG